MRNINLKGGAMGSGMIRFDPVSSAGNWASNPFGTTDYGIYVNTSDQLVFSSKGSTTILAAAGGGSGSVPSWEQIFAGDQTMQLAGTTWTIDNNTGTNDVLTITNSGASTGSLIQITNAGSGSDIKGTSATWSVSKAGLAVFTQITCPILYSAASQIISCAGAGTITIGANSNTITMADATTFSATVTVTDGITLLQSTANNANALTVVNNTATTYGDASASTGVARISSTSLTTGTLLKLQLTEGTLTTGWYFNCYNVTGSASVFKIAKYGATTIAGSAYATAALTVTAGDVVVSAGKITHTAAGATTTNGFAGTYNGLTTGFGMTLTHSVATVIASGGSLLNVSSAGVDTATTSGCLLNLASTASTAGTQVLMTYSALATGIGVSMVLAALTTGQGINIAHSTTAIADGGSLIALSSSFANTGGATNGTMLDIKGTGQLAGTMVRLDTIQTTGTAMSIISTGIMTTTGNLLTLTANSATTAAGLLRVNGNGLSDGIGIAVASSSAVLTATGRLLKITHSGAATAAGAGILAEITSNATDATTVAKVTASGTLIAGKVLFVSAAAMTTGTGIAMTDLAALTTGVGLSIAHATSAIADTGSLVRIASSGVNTGGATNGTMLDINASGQLAGTAVKIQGIQTSGTAIQVIQTGIQLSGSVMTITANAATTLTSGILAISGTGLTTGIGLLVTGGGANMTTAGIGLSVAMGAATVGSGIKVVNAGAYTDAASAVVNIVASTASTTGNILAVTTLSSKAIIAGLTLANPAFQVDCSTASSVTGALLKSNASGLGFAISVQSSSGTEPLTVDSKGTGILNLNGTATGIVVMGRGALKTFVQGNTATAIGTQNGTPSAAQLIGGLIVHTSTTGSGTLTVDTGTNIDAQVSGAAVGDTFTCVYANIGNQTVTITANTDVTLKGTAAVPTLKNALLTFNRTGAHVWVCYITLSA